MLSLVFYCACACLTEKREVNFKLCMATGGGSTSGSAARRARDYSPSYAELVMESMVYDYDSDTGETIGRFSPSVALADFAFEVTYSDEGDSTDGGPPWEGGGYDYHFVSDVPNTLQCLICATVAREAQQVDCCGKVFCKCCLHKLKRAQNKACPNCRKGKWKSFSDKKSKDMHSYCEMRWHAF